MLIANLSGTVKAAYDMKATNSCDDCRLLQFALWSLAQTIRLVPDPDELRRSYLELRRLRSYRGRGANRRRVDQVIHTSGRRLRKTMVPAAFGEILRGTVRVVAERLRHLPRGRARDQHLEDNGLSKLLEGIADRATRTVALEIAGAYLGISARQLQRVLSSSPKGFPVTVTPVDGRRLMIADGWRSELYVSGSRLAWRLVEASSLKGGDAV